MCGWREQVGQIGFFRWLLIGWAVVLGLMSAGLVVWILVRLAVLALVVAVPVVVVVAGTRALVKWVRRRQAERRGHEVVEVSRVCEVGGDWRC